MQVFDTRPSVAVMLGGTSGGTRIAVENFARAALRFPLPDFLEKLRNHASPEGIVEICEGTLICVIRGTPYRTPYSYGAYFRTNFEPLEPRGLSEWAANSRYSHLLIVPDEGQDGSWIVFLGDMQEEWSVCHHRVAADPEGFGQNPFGPFKPVRF